VEDQPIPTKELQKYDYLELHDSEIPDYLRKNGFPTEFIDIIMKDEIHRKHPERGCTPSALRVYWGRPMNVSLFWGNNMQLIIHSNKKSLSEFVFLKDTTEKMLD
jgi:hypothetical protein